MRSQARVAVIGGGALGASLLYHLALRGWTDTILLEKGSLDGLTYVLVGDMRMRTMHSILYALSQFDAKAIVVGPPDMSLLPEFKAEIDELNVDYEEAAILATALLVLLVTTVVSFLPTRRIARLKPTDALRGKMA